MHKICLANQNSLNNIKLSFALHALRTEQGKLLGGKKGIDGRSLFASVSLLVKGRK